MTTKKKIAFITMAVIEYVFLGYVLLYLLFSNYLTDKFTYLLFLIMGVYIGCKMTVWSIKTLKEKEE